MRIYEKLNLRMDEFLTLGMSMFFFLFLIHWMNALLSKQISSVELVSLLTFKIYVPEMLHVVV